MKNPKPTQPNKKPRQNKSQTNRQTNQTLGYRLCAALSWMLVTVSCGLLCMMKTVCVFCNTDTKLSVILLLNIVILLLLIDGAGDLGAQLWWQQREQTDF